MKHFLKLLSIVVFLIPLTACETYEGLKDDIASIDLSSMTPAVAETPEDKHSNFLVDGDCPKIEVVDELSMLAEYATPNSPSPSQKISSVEINNAESTCTYGERSVTVDLKLDFAGNLGPMGKASPTDRPFFSYPYFVAVTSSSGKILAKEIFAASVTYESGQNAKNYHETLRQIIPAENRTQGSRYKIMVGFQLTKAQLAENRAILEARRLEEEARAKALKMLEVEKAKEAKAAAGMAQSSAAAIQETGPAITIEKTTTPKSAGPIDITSP